MFVGPKLFKLDVNVKYQAVKAHYNFVSPNFLSFEFPFHCV